MTMNRTLGGDKKAYMLSWPQLLPKSRAQPLLDQRPWAT